MLVFLFLPWVWAVSLTLSLRHRQKHGMSPSSWSGLLSQYFRKKENSFERRSFVFVVMAATLFSYWEGMVWFLLDRPFQEYLLLPAGLLLIGVLVANYVRSNLVRYTTARGIVLLWVVSAMLLGAVFSLSFFAPWIYFRLRKLPSETRINKKL